jgi:ribosome assembly protein RRB1
MRFSDLSLTKYDDDEVLDKSFEDVDPVLYYEKIPLSSSVNRVKSLQHNAIVGIMNESAQLQIHDLRPSFKKLKAKKEDDPLETKGKPKILKQFMLSSEGYGLDFSPLVIGRIACGTQDGTLYIINPADENLSDLTMLNEKITKHTGSIEDIQFSPTEPDVLASCSVDGTIRIFDLRTPFANISELKIEAHNTDVNVISWNKISPNLMASGADNGEFKVWDLRYVGKPAITNIQWHTDPITSIEWQPHDEWTLAVASSDNRLSIWDFSVEKDDQEMVDDNLQNIPDQLLFLHQGQDDLKESKWHPVYKNILISTAADGYNVFEPGITEGDSNSVGSPNDLELAPDFN